MASAGARCEHVNHVMTQLPYAAAAAAVSFVTYLAAGFVQTPWIALPVGILLMACAWPFCGFSEIRFRNKAYSSPSNCIL